MASITLDTSVARPMDSPASPALLSPIVGTVHDDPSHLAALLKRDLASHPQMATLTSIMGTYPLDPSVSMHGGPSEMEKLLRVARQRHLELVTMDHLTVPTSPESKKESSLAWRAHRRSSLQESTPRGTKRVAASDGYRKASTPAPVSSMTRHYQHPSLLRAHEWEPQEYLSLRDIQAKQRAHAFYRASPLPETSTSMASTASIDPPMLPFLPAFMMTAIKQIMAARAKRSSASFLYLPLKTIDVAHTIAILYPHLQYLLTTTALQCAVNLVAVLSADVTSSALPETVADLLHIASQVATKSGGFALGLQCDVTKEQALQAWEHQLGAAGHAFRDQVQSWTSRQGEGWRSMGDDITEFCRQLYFDTLLPTSATQAAAVGDAESAAQQPPRKIVKLTLRSD